MELHLSPEQEQKFSQLALTKGCDVDFLAQEALDQYLESETRFIESVKLGEADFERGEYLTHEEVGKRIDQLFPRS